MLGMRLTVGCLELVTQEERRNTCDRGLSSTGPNIRVGRPSRRRLISHSHSSEITTLCQTHTSTHITHQPHALSPTIYILEFQKAGISGTLQTLRKPPVLYQLVAIIHLLWLPAVGVRTVSSNTSTPRSARMPLVPCPMATIPRLTKPSRDVCCWSTSRHSNATTRTPGLQMVLAWAFRKSRQPWRTSQASSNLAR